MTPWADIKRQCPKLYRGDVIFECGRGWSDIILDLSLKIEEILNKNPEENEMYAVQIKEKYGTLRFYMSCETDEIIDLISDTEALSSQTCESCGAPARMRGFRWVETKCDKCWENKK